MLARNYQNALKTRLEALFRATQGRNPLLARGGEGGRATVRNARLAHRFRAVSYELGTSLELSRSTRDSEAAYTQ